MRVDFVITELFVGGAERCLTEVAIGLAEHGDDVRVFSLARLPSGQQRQLVQRLEAAEIAVESGNADRPSQFFRAGRKLKTWLRASPPDICQTFLYHANVLGTFAAKSAGIASKVGGLRVAEAKPFRCRVERQAVKRMDSLICVSQAVRRFAADQLGCDSHKSIVIPNGVDVGRFTTTTPFSWADIGWPPESVVTLFVGRLHRQKGIELIQKQIDRLAPGGTNRRVLLVGDGPLRQDLTNWATSVGADRVQLLPWQSDIAPLMKAARVLLLPSRYEGMPNVVLEAMASGKPVVCSRVEGSEELLAHDREDQSFVAGDSEAMAGLVERFLMDAAFSDKIGIRNREHVRTEFSIPIMIDAYRQHYRTLMSNQ